MATKRQKQIIVTLLVVAIMIILFASGVLKLPFTITGTSTLSLNTANLQSSHFVLNGKVWLLSFREGGLSQRYYGTFSPSDVQDATSDNSRTTNSFSIDVEYEDQTCNYGITATSSLKPLYDIERITWTYVPLINPCSQEEANSRGMSNTLYVGKYFGLECFAIGYNTQSPVGRLDSPNLESQYEITVNAGGKLASRTINTLSGSSQGQIGDFAYAVWQGNLGTGISCPDKDPHIPLYINGVWRLGDADAYEDYKSLLTQVATTDKNIQDIKLEQLQNAIVRTKQYKSFGTLNSATSLNNAVVKVTIQSPVQFPVTTLYIKADTVGIYTPTPEIRLFNPNSECFKTGETGSIGVGLENVGEEAGTWTIFAECQSPFTSTQSIQVSLQPGQSVTRLIPLSASANQEVTGNCVITAESPAGSKQITTNVCVKPQITCTANQEFCSVSGNSDVVRRCSSDGATSTIIETCSYGKYCFDGECVVGERPPTEGFFSRLFADISNSIKQLFAGTLDFFSILRWIVVAIVLIFTTLFSYDFLPRLFKFLKGKKAISFVLSLVLALLLGYLVFTAFWVGVIIFIGYIIFRLLVGGTLLKVKRSVGALRG